MEMKKKTPLHTQHEEMCSKSQQKKNRNRKTRNDVNKNEKENEK